MFLLIKTSVNQKINVNPWCDSICITEMHRCTSALYHQSNPHSTCASYHSGLQWKPFNQLSIRIQNDITFWVMSRLRLTSWTTWKESSELFLNNDADEMSESWRGLALFDFSERKEKGQSWLVKLKWCHFTVLVLSLQSTVHCFTNQQWRKKIDLSKIKVSLLNLFRMIGSAVLKNPFQKCI